MTTRVQLGKLPNGDYGLRVVSADGTTVIIDGTSNMFKIQATGTMSRTQSDPGGGTLIITLPGLGTFTTTPAHAAYLGTTTSSNDRKRGSLSFGTFGSDMFVASSSGGSPTIKMIAPVTQGEFATEINASSLVEIRLFTQNRGQGSDITYYCRYYIFDETAI